MACSNSSPSMVDPLRNRNTYMPIIMESIKNDYEPKVVANNFQHVTTFIQTFEIEVINDELLSLMAPVIRDNVLKCYDDNIMVVTMTDNMEMQDVIKENLETAANLLLIFKDIIAYLLQQPNLLLKNVQAIPDTVKISLYSTFKHCRESQDLYKKQFTSQLLDLFRAAQELHSNILKIVEACKEFEEDIKEITQFLDMFIDLAEVLADINVKSMVDTWKTYISTVNKFPTTLHHTINNNLNEAFVCLKRIIMKTFVGYQELVQNDEDSAVKVAKLLDFLIKVFLKLCDAFPNSLEEFYDLIFELCVSFYSYKPNTSMITLLEPLLMKLSEKPEFLKFLENVDVNEQISVGVLRILLFIFTHNYSCDNVICKVFESVKYCYGVLTFHDQGLYEELLIFLTALALDNNNNMDRLLLANILEENIWCSMLASDVWFLVTSNMPPQSIIESLDKLITTYNKLNFDLFTPRVEVVHLTNLIKRIYDSAPVNIKEQIITKYPLEENLKLWNTLGFSHVSGQKIRHLSDTCGAKMLTVESLNTINNVAEFLRAMDYLEVYCGLNQTGATVKLYDLWSFNKNVAVFESNIFGIFVHKLCALTIKSIGNFNKMQIMFILDCLTNLGEQPQYKLMTTEILQALIHTNRQDFGTDQFKIFRLLTGLIYPILLNNVKPPVKTQIYGLLLVMYNNPPYNDAVKIILQNAKQLQGEISDYLRKYVHANVNSDYIQSLEKCTYRHACQSWNHAEIREIFHTTRPRSIKNQTKEPPPKRAKIEEGLEEESSSNVADCLSALKGDVKCLMNVLKTEKMSSKEWSQLKVMVGQLQGLV